MEVFAFWKADSSGAKVGNGLSGARSALLSVHMEALPSFPEKIGCLDQMALTQEMTKIFVKIESMIHIRFGEIKR